MATDEMRLPGVIRILGRKALRLLLEIIASPGTPAQRLCNLYNGNFYSNFCRAVGEPMSPHMLTAAVNLLARSSPLVRRLDHAGAMVQRPLLRIISDPAAV
jgi:hypothetical protein